MSTLNDLYESIYDIARRVVQKGGVISSSNISPSFKDIMNGIDSIPQANVNLTGAANVLVAEMPNVTITMEDESGNIIDTKTTNATVGGAVTFSTENFGNYRFTATDSDSNVIWTKLFSVPNAGLHYCKVGKAFTDYTPAEINLAAKNDYAKIMWSVGDTISITTIGSKKTYHIAGFNHYAKADGSGYCGLVLEMNDYTNSSYKHNATNDNTIGWEGSLIRQNGLAAGDVYYLRATVDSATEGTYYVYDEFAKDWVEKALPSEYDETEIYYTKNTLEADGAFITGLPDWKDYIVQVETATADAGSGFKKIIVSKDRVFLPSDAEVFGSNNRYSKYSQYDLEGQQYDYYKNNWSDGKVRASGSWWLRSPCSGSATSFCCVVNSGCVSSNNASFGNYARLVFCL
ncbi:MAG: DUF6273 domain-containing protein [Christensenellales bacterium]